MSVSAIGEHDMNLAMFVSVNETSMDRERSTNSLMPMNVWH